MECVSGFRNHTWWGETHFGDGNVKKFGHSTYGELWDVTEQADTCYESSPSFGYGFMGGKHLSGSTPRLDSDSNVSCTALACTL